MFNLNLYVMETKNDQLLAIWESYINGQAKQMAEQIDEYNDMYNVFEDLKIYMIETGCEIFDANRNLVDIVIKYHRVKFR